MNMQIEEMYRARFVGKDMECQWSAVHALSRRPFFQHLYVLFTNAEALRTPYYWKFHHVGMIDH